jgi:hypothetical protein
VAVPGTVRAIAEVDAGVAERVFGSSDAIVLGGWPGATKGQTWASYAQFADDVETGSISKDVRVAMYDPENWEPTPLAERLDPLGSIEAFCALARSHGYFVLITPHANLVSVPKSIHAPRAGETREEAFLRSGIVEASAANADAADVRALALVGLAPVHPGLGLLPPRLMLRVFLPPLITVYAIFVAMVVVAVRRPVRRPGRIGDRSAPRYPGRLIGTIVGGYGTFLAIVLVFHVWIADQPEAFPSALWGGAFLCGVTLALAAVSSLLTRHRARRVMHPVGQRQGSRQGSRPRSPTVRPEPCHRSGTCTTCPYLDRALGRNDRIVFHGGTTPSR